MWTAVSKPIGRATVGGAVRAARLAPAARQLAILRPSKQVEHLIVGGGVSCGYAAREFVAQGVNADQVMMVTEELALPYERPALSKGFLAAESPARLPGFHTSVGAGGPCQDLTWYQRNGVQRLLKSRVAKVDVENKQVTLARGSIIEYESLIVATGASAVKAAAFDATLYLRSVDDAELLVAALEKVPENGHAVVIGGGYIGVEVAAAIVGRGIRVTVVSPEETLLSRAVPGPAATVYQDAFSDAGALVVSGATVTGVAKDASSGKRLVTIAGGGGADAIELEADLVVAGLGASPNSDMFAGQLAIDEAGGIVVDGEMRTSAPGVWAVGDVASFPLACEGGVLTKSGHVAHARASAAHAVRSILGRCDGAYEHVPHYYSRFLGFAWQAHGVQEGECVPFGTFQQGGRFGAIWHRDGVVVGTFLDGASDSDHARFASFARSRPEFTPEFRSENVSQ